jgi:hypothetical protein
VRPADRADAFITLGTVFIAQTGIEFMSGITDLWHGSHATFMGFLTENVDISSTSPAVIVITVRASILPADRAYAMVPASAILITQTSILIRVAIRTAPAMPGEVHRLPDTAAIAVLFSNVGISSAGRAVIFITVRTVLPADRADAFETARAPVIAQACIFIMIGLAMRRDCPDAPGISFFPACRRCRFHVKQPLRFRWIR